MTTFWRRGTDNLKNGAILGILIGVAVIWGNKLYSWLLINVPAAWTNTVPLWLWILAVGAIIGYFVDRH